MLRLHSAVSASASAAIAVALLVLATPLSAAADEVQLSNGDRLTGRVVSLSGGTLVFSTPHGELKIPWELVTSLTIDEPIVVTTGGAGEVTAEAQRATGDAANGLVLDPGGQVPFNEVQAIARPAPAIVVDGAANAGFVTSDGSTDVNSLRLDGELTVRAGSNRYNTSAAITRSRDRGVETARNWTAVGKYDRFVSDRLFINANGIFTNDPFRDLDLRTALGAGLGYQVLGGPRVRLTTDAGLGWVDENLIAAPDDRYTAARESASLDVVLFPSRLELFHRHDGYFGVTGEDNMFVRTQNGVRLLLGAGMVAVTRLDVDYDRSPTGGLENTQRTFALTLGYQF